MTTEAEVPGPSRRAAATLQEVARAAGVSKSSASRALDPGSQYVSSALREKVLAAAERLGYRPNTSAQATTRGTTAIIVVLVSDIRDPYNAELLHGVVEGAAEAGLVATIAGTDYATEDETRTVRLMRSLRPRAMILTGARLGSPASRGALRQELAHYIAEGGRVVVAGDDELPFDTLVVPRRAGSAALLEALFDIGYRSPALILPDHDSMASREWEAGIGDTAHRLGLAIDATVRAPTTRDGGYEAAARLLELRSRRFDVVLAATDTIAIGAMSAIRDSGLMPGQDIGVAGFDDLVGARDVTPELTSVDLGLSRIGAAAVELAAGAAGPTRQVLHSDLRVVLRGSTPNRPGDDETQVGIASDLGECRPMSLLFEPEPAARRPVATPIRPVAHSGPRNRPVGPDAPANSL